MFVTGNNQALGTSDWVTGMREVLEVQLQLLVMQICEGRLCKM